MGVSAVETNRKRCFQLIRLSSGSKLLCIIAILLLALPLYSEQHECVRSFLVRTLTACCKNDFSLESACRQCYFKIAIHVVAFPQKIHFAFIGSETGRTALL